MDADLKSRGCEITLTCKASGKSIKIILNHNHERWIVLAEKAQLYFSELEPAVKAALAVIKEES